MQDLTSLVLLAISVLLVKHAIADFFLQTAYQYRNKGIYGHPGGLLHAGIHAVSTLPVFLVLSPASLAMGALIPVGEFVVHYHIDWLKEQFLKHYCCTLTTPGFWHALGVDQLAHGLTYVAIVAILIS